jgi:hypothetical protein
MIAKRRRTGYAEPALRGALSGALAGAAMLVAEHIGEATDLARGPTVGRRWASRLGQGRRPRRRVAVGWATHIAYSALLGAAYGVVRSHGQLSRPAQGLVASALAYAAWLPNRTPAPKRGPRVKKLAAQRSPMLYSGALMSGFETLAKR